MTQGSYELVLLNHKSFIYNTFSMVCINEKVSTKKVKYDKTEGTIYLDLPLV